ncbi:putative WD repeat-containing protein [Diplonema papillatum]|nr:putative WD repeat-containing protein [Diplonema papillatum]
MDLETAKRGLAAMQEALAADVYSWWPTALTAFVSLLVIVVAVPFIIIFFTKTGQMEADPTTLRQQRKLRRPKWTLDDPTQKKDTPMEMRGKGSVAAAVKRYQDKQANDTDSDSEEEDKILTPEQILAQHQEIPREPHVGIFVGVDDPLPQASSTASRNARSAADARDIAEAMGKCDFRTFALHDHKSHKNISEAASMPTRLNVAQLLRSLKEGKYDDATRKKPNLTEWENCLIYLSTRVRITTYGNQKSETLEFLLRQDVEMDPVWIDMVELINKISDIPFRHLFVFLDVVHTGEDDIAYDDGEDRPNPGKPCCMAEILKRTGVMSGIVNSQRCSVLGITRPESMPKEVPAGFIEGLDKAKMRNGPLVHFLLAGLREVEKRDPNAEMWKTMASVGGGGMGGGFGMMPTVAPTTSGDLSICPYHCGDMTVDSIYRFCSKKIRLLLKDPLHDPAYHVGHVKTRIAMQKAIRPRDTPETPPYMHECKRDNIKNEVIDLIKPKGERKHVSVALLGPSAVGKSSIMLSTAWTKETLDAFSDGVYYYSVHETIDNLKAAGKMFIPDMQQSLAYQAAAFEGQLQNYDNASHYMAKHFAGMKALVLLDDVKQASDLEAIFSEVGITDNEKAATVFIITTTSKAVSDMCTHTIKVPSLSDTEAKGLVASGAGLISPDDLPDRTEALLKACNNLPLYAALIGSAMRGADDDKWDALFKQVAASDGDTKKIMDAIFDAMPPTTSAALRALACIPANRAVSLSALMTFWQGPIGADRNKLNAVLANVLECGAGRLIVEEEWCFLIHPLVSEYLNPEDGTDEAIVKIYAEQNGIPPEEQEDVSRWTQVGWDGYYHTYGPSHLAKEHGALVEKLYSNPQWILTQHEACKIDKLLCDIQAYGGSSDDVLCIREALEKASPQLRRHPWEITTQLLLQLSSLEKENVRTFCDSIQEHSRPAAPSDRYLLWLKPVYKLNAFDDKTPCTCVAFYKDYIVGGYKNGVVQLWNLKDGSKHKQLIGHKAAVHGVVPSATGKLCTGSKDEEPGSKIREWDIETGEGKVLSIVERPDPEASKPAKLFKLKVSLGETGTDIRDHDQDSFGYASTRHTVRDTVLVEYEQDDESVNCHTFMGWNSHLVCTSVTFPRPLHEARSTEHMGRFWVAAGDDDGDVSIFMMHTNDVPVQPSAELSSE